MWLVRFRARGLQSTSWPQFFYLVTSSRRSPYVTWQLQQQLARNVFQMAAQLMNWAPPSYLIGSVMCYIPTFNRSLDVVIWSQSLSSGKFYFDISKKIKKLYRGVYSSNRESRRHWKQKLSSRFIYSGQRCNQNCCGDCAITI